MSDTSFLQIAKQPIFTSLTFRNFCDGLSFMINQVGFQTLGVVKMEDWGWKMTLACRLAINTDCFVD